jgi:hypothetical protein
MPTLRPILKYTPAVVMGLLVAMWVFGSFAHPTIRFDPFGPCPEVDIGVDGGTVYSAFCVKDTKRSAVDLNPANPPTVKRMLGRYLVARDTQSALFSFVVAFPLLLPITILLPLAIGPFISFRFRLLHYLAFTALVAVELAFYLRWQE